MSVSLAHLYVITNYVAPSMIRAVQRNIESRKPQLFVPPRRQVNFLLSLIIYLSTYKGRSFGMRQQQRFAT